MADAGKRDVVHAAVDRAEKERGGFGVIASNAGTAQFLLQAY